MLSTFAALSVNSAKDLARGVTRCFAALSMTTGGDRDAPGRPVSLSMAKGGHKGN